MSNAPRLLFVSQRPAMNTSQVLWLPLTREITLHHRTCPGIEEAHITQRSPLLLVACTPSLLKYSSYSTFQDIWSSYVIDAQNGKRAGGVGARVSGSGIGPIENTRDAPTIRYNIERAIIQMQQEISAMLNASQALM